VKVSGKRIVILFGMSTVAGSTATRGCGQIIGSVSVDRLCSVTVIVAVVSHSDVRLISVIRLAVAGRNVPRGGRQAAALGRSPHFSGETSYSDHKVVFPLRSVKRRRSAIIARATRDNYFLIFNVNQEIGNPGFFLHDFACFLHRVQLQELFPGPSDRSDP
jgi:hypothetical protein